MRTILYATPPAHLMSVALHGEVADEVQRIAADYMGIDADSFQGVVVNREHDHGNAAVTFDGEDVVDIEPFKIDWCRVSGGSGL